MEFAACRGAGRRIDRRVTARTTAKPSAANPAPSAASEPIEEPLDSADTFATGVSLSEPGAIVGNRLAALPPGLVVEVDAMLDSGMGDSDAALADAWTVREADAAGTVARLAALPVTVRLTAVTVVAVAGTVTSAWNSRWAEVASTAPRLHADVPSPTPQPKVKTGMPAPVVDFSAMLASGTLPPSVQAPTSHWDACPRTLVCCSGRIPTHKLTGVVVAAAAVVAAAVGVGVAVAAAAWNAVSTMA